MNIKYGLCGSGYCTIVVFVKCELVSGRLCTMKILVVIYFGGLVKVVGTTANILAGMVTCEIILISICGGGSVNIWLMCKGNHVQFDTTIDGGLDVNKAGVWRAS